MNMSHWGSEAQTPPSGHFGKELQALGTPFLREICGGG